MLYGLTVLLVFQLIGESLAYAFALPIPGPVIGMLLLFAVLQWRGANEQLRLTATTLLSHLSLLFVPAGVGIITYGALLKTEWLSLLVTVIVSTAITLTMSALTVSFLYRRKTLK